MSYLNTYWHHEVVTVKQRHPGSIFSCWTCPLAYSSPSFRPATLGQKSLKLVHPWMQAEKIDFRPPACVPRWVYLYREPDTDLIRPVTRDVWPNKLLWLHLCWYWYAAAPPSVHVADSNWIIKPSFKAQKRFVLNINVRLNIINIEQ